MSYYSNRRYAPPADVYAASTLIGPHTGANAQTPPANWPFRLWNGQPVKPPTPPFDLNKAPAAPF